jgi:hypothetical protein
MAGQQRGGTHVDVVVNVNLDGDGDVNVGETR